MAPASTTRFRSLLWGALICCLIFVGLQFIRPELTNPPVTAEIQAPPEVKQVLRNSCYSCHSNETKLPWYDQVVPAYWLVANDVKEARERLNFSEIGKLPPAQQKAALYEALSQIQLGAMPLPSYLRVHPHAAVTPEQIAILRKYLDSSVEMKPAAPTDTSAADFQYQKWVAEGGKQLQVTPAPNGIAFLPEYKNWRAISSTDRFDNHTMRVILGNDIAVKAIAENHINPWPDGATFAKVAWFQQPDAEGTIHTGAFQQVEFMIRDSKKYATTAGWGWARWRGTELKPYGKGADFSKECIGCHTPVRQNDYVFTAPIQTGEGL